VLTSPNELGARRRGISAQRIGGNDVQLDVKSP